MQIRTLYLLIPCFLFICSQASGQHLKNKTPGEIYHAIEKLNVLGSVLYVAAHPDDENTRAISYFANHVKARTTYLSITRGDGGQNLIGPEISELLGVIRTQELLAARRIDGGEQWFTRANDFGYSKHPDETLSIWDKEEVLKDVVMAIRKFKPDIIINRFNHTSGGETHGHHTASAILSFEAFDLAGNPNHFPEQLRIVNPHQPSRLFFNTSWWFYGSQERFEQADKSDLVEIDMGIYFPWKGMSNSEIAAESRSQHKCQGFGSTGSRGTDVEYFKILKGEMPEKNGNLFDGIDISWSRVQGGAHITALINDVLNQYNFKKPHESVPLLLKIYSEIEKLPDGYWKNIKLNELSEIIEACLGLFLEVTTQQHKVVPGNQLPINVEATNRSIIPIIVRSVRVENTDFDTTLNLLMDANKPVVFRKNIKSHQETPLTGPYWLKEASSIGMYTVNDPHLIGKPETLCPLIAHFQLEIYGKKINYKKVLRYKYNSPEDGQTYRPLEIVPPVLVKFPEQVYAFRSGSAKDIHVNVLNMDVTHEATLSVKLPESWKAEPAEIIFQPKTRGSEESFSFKVTSPSHASEGTIRAIIQWEGNEYAWEMTTIDYPHIPFQTIIKPSVSRIVSIDMETTDHKIAYIQGAGDDIPASLRQMGYHVDIMNASQINRETLQSYQTVVMGIRAYNKWDVLNHKQKELLDFVHDGGNMIVQYNTSNGLVTNQLGPYPITLSRDRVSVEESPVRILAKDHRVMQFPNIITDKDFEGWVQERGLYFPGTWDERYAPVLSSNDPGESPKDGGLLVARYGNGWFIYTGYSWFRQLPAGVPGAYRLFANFIALNGEN